MRNKLILLSVIVLFVGSSFADPGTVTYYQDYNAWLAATSPAAFNPPGCGNAWCHYAFQSLPVNQSQNPFTSVVSSAGHFGAPSGVFVGTYDQVWTDRVTLGGNEFTTWSLATGQPLYAFGGYWDFSPAMEGQGLTLTIAGSFGSMAIGDICSSLSSSCGPAIHTFTVDNGTWFGIVTDFAFDSFTITADHAGGVAETFDLAGLDMATVPEPGSMILLGTGLFGLAGAIRRRLTR